MDTRLEPLGSDDGQYAVQPLGGPEQVLKYLARYTHRVAISNQRLVDLEDGKVRFHWKDYAHGGASKTMTLQAVEFIRRFLLHVLPLYFVRIRHYGFLANRVCQEKLGVDAASEPLSAPKEPVEGPSTANLCPSCGNGRMVIVETLRPTRTHQGQEAGAPTLKQARFDTS
jgi:hypothetical protein